MIICTKFDQNWPSGSGEDLKKNSVFKKKTFCYHLPLGRGVILHLNNFDSLFPKDDLCQVSGSGEEVENVKV
jgi:hypothetical protein